MLDKRDNKSKSQIKPYAVYVIRKVYYIILAGILIAYSCENDIAKINNVTSDQQMSTVSGTNVEIIYSDSAIVRIKIKAPKINKFDDIKPPTIKFPNGILVYFYDKDHNVESRIKANQAIYYQEKKLWEATNDVEAKNFKTNEQLNTEHLFWDEKQGKIYSDKFCRIINNDGTFYGENGFEAAQDLSRWKLKRSKGVVTIKDE